MGQPRRARPKGPLRLGVSLSGALPLCLGALALCLCLAAATPAQAASPLKIREVFPGSDAHGANAEFVELQMTANGQSDIDGQELHFYEADGDIGSSYTIPTDVANGASQRTVLLATQEAIDAAIVPAPDFNLGSGSNRMSPTGGAVCLTGTGPSSDDCVTWGSIPISDPFSPFLANPQAANAAVIGDGKSLARKITAGCPTYLDTSDDSDNSSTDFELTSPSPRNNATAPTETPCPPNTAIGNGPSNPSSSAAAAFTYAETPTEPGASFECKLDAATFAPCPEAGKSYPGPLSEGSHNFQVRAIGEGGADPTPASRTWTVDTIVPETSITSFPPSPSGGFSASFTYQSSEPSSSFRCQLDFGAIQGCAGAGKTYFQLTDGPHVFRVWAKDNAGNEDPTPAQHVFTVEGVLIDLTPPDTTITAAPPNPSPSESASFAYASTEQGSSFQCRLAPAPFAPCPATGQSYGPLKNATYTFEVRATDPAGNVDSVPASYSWRVAAPPPRTRFVKAPPGRVNLKRGRKAKLVFRYRADKPVSGFRCRLNKQRFRACKAIKRLRVRPGRHRFEVYAIDSLGNVEPRPQRRIVRVQRKKRGGGLF